MEMNRDPHLRDTSATPERDYANYDLLLNVRTVNCMLLTTSKGNYKLGCNLLIDNSDWP